MHFSYWGGGGGGSLPPSLPPKVQVYVGSIRWGFGCVCIKELVLVGGGLVKGGFGKGWVLKIKKTNT